MRKSAFILLGLPFSTAVGAQEVPAYAQKAAAVANAIGSGQDLSTFEMVKPLSEAELAEIGKLAGCAGEILPGANKWRVNFKWVCAEPVDDVDVRRTEVGFTEDGVIRTITINPLAANFAPSEAAINSVKMEKPKDLAKRFGRAVETGGDPSLSGLVPLTDLQITQLRALAGEDHKVLSVTTDEKVYLTWEPGAATNGFSVTIYFDDARRPLGVETTKATIRTYSTITPIPAPVSPGRR